MALLSLPAEILLDIADYLFTKDLNHLLQVNHRLFYLLSSTFRTRVFEDKDNLPALHWACKHGHSSLVRTILDKDTSPINCPRKNLKRTPIWYAIRGGNESIVRLLLEKGVPGCIESRNRLDPSPLYVAAQSGHVEVAKLLLEYRALEHPGFSLGSLGSAPLAAAVMRGNTQMARLLIDYGANICGREVYFALRLCKSEEIFHLICDMFLRDIKILMQQNGGDRKGDFSFCHDAVGSGRVLMLKALMGRAELVMGGKEHGRALMKYARWLGIIVPTET